MNYKYILTLILSVLFFCSAYAQTQKQTFQIPLSAEILMNEPEDALRPDMKYKILPKPHSGTDQKTIDEARNFVHAQYRTKKHETANNNSNQKWAANPPVMLRNFIGNAFNFRVPNDNDMAVSNGDITCSVTNSMIYSKNLISGQNYGSYTLHSLATSLGLASEEFDPKVIYDPQSDRFVFVCLNGFTDTTSNILLGFSQSNSSYGTWNFYALPGNPLNNGLWTDFPMVSVSNSEVFITVNLLYPDSSWQTGFNETVIWQVNKQEGYSGALLNPLLHHNIKFNNEPLRNLCPVKGGSTLYGPNMYFVSNRNFTTGNDTTFLIEISDTINAPNQLINITPLIGNTSYHMPALADQPSTDLLIVNDARNLGALLENNKIQFVASTLDTASGLDGIYHGIIDLNGPQATLSTQTYTSSPYDLAYPNIAWAGNGVGDDRCIISVLYSGSNDFPGSAALLYDGTYSPLTIVKAGQSYTNMITGNERWGDYTGCHTKYNEPEKVWMAGSYTIANHQTRTWIAELSSNPAAGINYTETELELLSVYPNPVSERLSIDFELTSKGFVVVNLYDQKGALIHTLYRGGLATGKNSFSFNTHSLSSGGYLIRIDDVLNNKKLATKTFVKP
ncbi:MAG TPA: T9SS type A sorting domain-containing protein [Bacteroidia bacterium]|nr:T9SS type A sorting domain-containing protein [Bacteroidia bacterium]